MQTEQQSEQSQVGILEEFRTEFMAAWQRLPDKWLFLGLLAAWVLVFHILGNSTLGYVRTPSLLVWLYQAYNPVTEVPGGSEDAHGNVVPFLVLGLFWWKRKELLALPLRTWWPGVFIVMFALALHAMGYMIQQLRLSIVAMFVGIYGLMGLMWGPALLRASIFPFFLFIFSVPLGSLAQPITFRLQMLVCSSVEFVCHFIFAIDVVRDGAILKDPTGHYQYEVAVACSGIRSLMAILLMATSYAFVAFGGFWKRLVMIVSAFPLAVLGNLVRMLCIILTAAFWDEFFGKGGQAAGEWVHSNTFFSIIPYIPAILGLFALGRFLERVGGEPEDESSEPVPAQPLGAGANQSRSP